MNAHPSPRRAEYAAIALVSCAMLTHEILLTRVCALRLQFHFAFLIISNCLLGLGAAGSILFAYRERVYPDPPRWLARFSIAFLASLAVTYVCMIRLPLPTDIHLSNTFHVVILALFSLLGAVPFFFSGLVIGLLLSAHAREADRLYAADLIGAAIGCILCPGLLPWVGAGGVFVVSSLLALAACACLHVGERRPQHYAIGVGLLLAGLVLTPTMDRLLPVPSKPVQDLAIRILRPDQLRSVWTANSRIDLIRPEQCDMPIFMRGAHAMTRMPRECAEVTQDATAATTIINFSEEPEALDILRRSMYSAAFRLKEKPDVLVIGMGGGNDVWAAKAAGARSVKAIELNWPIVDIHENVLRRYSKGLVEDPNVQIVVDEGRSALMRDSSTYDVVQMTGIDTWTALASGGYVLAENYLYTREAIISMYRRLKPGGILQISRFAAQMEALRLMSNVDSALREEFGVRNIDQSVIALATPDFMMSLQVKKGVFSDAEQESVLRFGHEHGIFVAYLPKRPLSDGPYDRFLRSADKQRIIDEFPQNITPTTDDQPYFFNFTKWQDPIGSIRHIHDVPAISQGNPLFLFTQFAVSLLLSIALILWPLKRQSGTRSRGAARLLVFFAALGAGFISIEIAMLQKLTLLLGQPVYSLTVTLFSLLVFTGLGSLRLVSLLPTHGARAWLVPLGIVGYVALFSLGSTHLVDAVIGAPLSVRILVCILVLAPLGLLLGIPFAYGLRVTYALDPRLTPWAWAINGCLSVIGSILTVIISMNFGFTAVMWLAAGAYVVGFAALRSLDTIRAQ